jgi:hypothetical protein
VLRIAALLLAAGLVLVLIRLRHDLRQR